MELFTALIAAFVCIISVLIVAAVVRYAVDSSKTSRKLDLLMKEVRNLRAEVRGLQHTKGQDSQHIIDEKV
ncbi:hypothetical protein [Paenibacillus cucumis (ex Kampfer et al. 2016)]|uniref:DUF4083 domain-containing protein n=1 Tax=Paenibacillus cucumis (ex Kampfer et al. 2016) TaxID=1776858 RepID=A0ABS7KDZ7_9BACL|nr:hypothetical protein [Paenibacillus cucumis (ex Kampfer et al. 2016)]MBY0202364.1 hypothetical protein [Paenibacillus cucumis (ex Kampfer et al. 2016)]